VKQGARRAIGGGAFLLAVTTLILALQSPRWLPVAVFAWVTLAMIFATVLLVTGRRNSGSFKIWGIEWTAKAEPDNPSASKPDPQLRTSWLSRLLRRKPRGC